MPGLTDLYMGEVFYTLIQMVDLCAQAARIRIAMDWPIGGNGAVGGDHGPDRLRSQGFRKDSIATRPIRTECDDCVLPPANPAFFTICPQVPST